MTKNINIHYENGKFLVRCPIYANDALNGLSSKRWVKARRIWSVPALRRNITAINDLRPLATFTQEAEAALIEHNERLDQLITPSIGFPAWYKYKTKPRKHQETGANKAYGKNEFALFMDRGTGKSKLAIDLATALRMEGKIQAVMVIVRRSLRLNWVGYDHGDGTGQKEGFIGHCPIECSFHLPNGGDESAKKVYGGWLGEDHDFPVLIMSTESFSQGGAVTIAKSFLQSHIKVMVIVDESHDFGNHDSIRSKALHDLGLMAEYKLVLTGTPIMTGPMNLYSQFEFLNPNIIGIGDYYAFRNRYAVMGGFPNPKTGKPTQIIGYQNMDELAALLAPYVYEVRKSEVLDLPPKVFERRALQMTPEQKELYKKIKREKKYVHDGSDVDISNTLELALRLHQICGGFISRTVSEMVDGKNGPKVKKTTTWTQIIPPERNPKMMELLDIAADGDQSMIIWAAYKPEIEMIVGQLRNKFPSDIVVEMHGGISDEDREKNKILFQSKKARFLVGSTQAGGTGHTLTAAEIVYYWNNTEKMIDREQSEDRAHRDGLNHSVLYIDAMMENTVDGTIRDSIDAKMDLAEYIRLKIREVGDSLLGG